MTPRRFLKYIAVAAIAPAPPAAARATPMPLNVSMEAPEEGPAAASSFDGGPSTATGTGGLLASCTGIGCSWGCCTGSTASLPWMRALRRSSAARTASASRSAVKCALKFAKSTEPNPCRRQPRGTSSGLAASTHGSKATAQASALRDRAKYRRWVPSSGCVEALCAADSSLCRALVLTLRHVVECARGLTRSVCRIAHLGQDPVRTHTACEREQLLEGRINGKPHKSFDTALCMLGGEALQACLDIPIHAQMCRYWWGVNLGSKTW